MVKQNEDLKKRTSAQFEENFSWRNDVKMMIISLWTFSTWTRKSQVQKERSSQPKCLSVNVKNRIILLRFLRLSSSFPINNLWQCVEQECQLALGQLRRAGIQKKTLQWWWQWSGFMTRWKSCWCHLIQTAFTWEWYQEAKDQAQGFPPSRSLQSGCWEEPTLPHQLWYRPKIPLLAG